MGWMLQEKFFIEPEQSIEKRNKMNVNLRCKGCKRHFKLTKEILLEEKAEVVGLEDDRTSDITVLSCRCSNCGKEVVVQLDDFETIEMMKEIESTTKSILQRKGDGYSISAQEEKLRKLKGRLKFRRKYLSDTYVVFRGEVVTLTPVSFEMTMQ